MQNRKKITEALQQTAIRSLETLCFVFSSPAAHGPHDPATDPLIVEVRFQGTHAGSLVLKVAQNIVATLAGNMTGEGTMTDEQQRDAVGEIANVICGNFLPDAFGKGHVFEIAAPVIPQTVPADRSSVQVHLTVEAGWVDIVLRLDEMQDSRSG